MGRHINIPVAGYWTFPRIKYGTGSVQYDELLLIVVNFEPGPDLV